MQIRRYRRQTLTRTHLNLSLLASFDRLRTSGYLDEVEHTSAIRRCHGEEIATLRSQRQIGYGRNDKVGTHDWYALGTHEEMDNLALPL